MLRRRRRAPTVSDTGSHRLGIGWPFTDCALCAADYWSEDRYEKFDRWARSNDGETPWEMAMRHYRTLHSEHLP
jgi:hypothetical protein